MAERRMHVKSAAIFHHPLSIDFDTPSHVTIVSSCVTADS